MPRALDEGFAPRGRGTWFEARPRCRPPPFASGAGGLVSTADNYFAFAQELLDRGKHGGERTLSPGSVEAMTTDQLTPEQRAVSSLLPGYFAGQGGGFGMSALTRPDGRAAVPGRYGWDGGMGTSWFNDPKGGLVAIRMTSRMWNSPDPPAICREFWRLAYEAATR